MTIGLLYVDAHHLFFEKKQSVLIMEMAGDKQCFIQLTDMYTLNYNSKRLLNYYHYLIIHGNVVSLNKIDFIDIN